MIIKMYNKRVMDNLVRYVESLDGIADKAKLEEAVQKKFSLIQDRKVYTCDDFTIRFSKAEHKRMSNTVLSLSALQKYDNKPFIVCIVASEKNYLLLANSTFLKKISHSSKELRMDNIKGSFNGSDIMMEYNNRSNEPKNFKELYAYHLGLSFEDNLERLVESTNQIVGRVPKFKISAAERKIILEAVTRAKQFVSSKEYEDLRQDLEERVSAVRKEIATAALIDNVNLRGRVIEYLITAKSSAIKKQIMKSLHEKKRLPEFKTEDKLGDYSKVYPRFVTETDIKTKVLFLDGNPKAYNIDKLLEFLATDKSVYLIYLLGVDKNGEIEGRLCSALDVRLIKATNIQHHWAGRNTRGVTQFIGSALKDILDDSDEPLIEEKRAAAFLQELMER